MGLIREDTKKPRYRIAAAGLLLKLSLLVRAKAQEHFIRTRWVYRY